MTAPAFGRAVRIPVDEGVELEADLRVPSAAVGLVVFAHGSASSRFSPRNRSVAGGLEAAGFGALLLDLLIAPEAVADRWTGVHRFDVAMLGRRVVAAIDWARSSPPRPGPSRSSAPARVRRRPWWPRPSGLTRCARSSRGAGSLTWRERH